MSTASLTTANPDIFHRELAHFNSARLSIATPSPRWPDDLDAEYNYRLAEGHFLEGLRAAVASQVPPSFRSVDQFVGWFESLAVNGPGQQHPLFDWLADHTTLTQMRWFLTQEAAGEAGFDDLVAYTQVKLPTQAKLECARNYWDEMGRGKKSAMHGEMLAAMVRELDLRPSIDTTVWESLALSNTMLGLAMNRRYTYQALGALGAIELTAPGRVAKVAAGMRRLGIDGRKRAYFDVHATLDISHAEAWIREVIRPLVEADPECAIYLAEGALIRLTAGERCFERYSTELGIRSLHADAMVPL
ncbi:hypothetical protein BZM26_32315 [Paraburkholderia strydomiana]|nr:hypothetical protein BZM26_32315 [Paraburkholderia strydomiana]